MPAPKQLPLPYRPWGGPRRGAGRKRGPNGGPAHRARPTFRADQPAHVTLRIAAGLPSLRTERCFAALRRAFRGGRRRDGFRLVHFSVQGNHIHLVIEAAGASALARGVGALAIRLARQLNRALGRRGRVFARRYHARVLGTPREVHGVLRYVLLNGRRHASPASIARERAVLLDPCSSAACFDGWLPGAPIRAAPAWREPVRELVVPAETWLLRRGWRAWGPIDPAAVPG